MVSPMTLRMSALFLAAGLALGGCLRQPVNRPELGNASMAAKLSQVSVDRVDGIIWVYPESLNSMTLMTNGQPAKNSRYKLGVRTSTRRRIQHYRCNNCSRANRNFASSRAVYELKVRDTVSNTIKGSGKTFASASFDRSQQRFANDSRPSVTQRNASERHLPSASASS